MAQDWPIFYDTVILGGVKASEHSYKVVWS